MSSVQKAATLARILDSIFNLILQFYEQASAIIGASSIPFYQKITGEEEGKGAGKERRRPQEAHW